MDLIELLFKLVQKFVPLSLESYNQMYQEANDWKSKLKKDSDNAIERMYVNLTYKWFFRLGCAVAYIPLCKIIMDMQRPEIIEEQ